MTANPHLSQASTHYGEPVDTAELLVLGVHGRGQDPGYMAGLAQRIGAGRVGYVFPRAAEGSWYPQGFMAPLEQNQPSLDFALEAVHRSIQRLVEAGIARERIVLMGFSQGACLLSEYLLRNPAPYAAAVLLTGGFLGPEEGAWAESGRTLEGLPVYMGCSINDGWVPVPRVQSTRQALERRGAQVELRLFDETEHHVNDTSIQRVAALFQELAASRAAGAAHG